MKIAVIDCSISGHRETYYKTFTRAWASLGHEVLLLAPRESGMNGIAAFQKIETHPLLPLPAGKPIKKKFVVLQNAWIRLRNLAILRKQLKDFHPDLVYFPCLDDLLPTLATLKLFNRLFPYPWSGLLVQSIFPPYKAGIPDIRPFLRSPFCQGIGVLNEYSIESLKAFQTDIKRLPDFADLSEANEEYDLLHTLRNKAKGRKIIALLGSIGTRKGIQLLLRTIPLLPEEEYFFFLAGKSWLTETQTQELKTVESTRNNCLFSLQHIPDEACFNALVSASDVLFAAYYNFSGSSNLLTKAAAFGKPILVSSGECMGKRVSDYGIGIAIPQEDADKCRQAIIDLCRQGAPQPQNFTKYAAEHSLNKLSEGLAALQSPITKP